MKCLFAVISLIGIIGVTPSTALAQLPYKFSCSRSLERQRFEVPNQSVSIELSDAKSNPVTITLTTTTIDGSKAVIEKREFKDFMCMIKRKSFVFGSSFINSAVCLKQESEDITTVLKITREPSVGEVSDAGRGPQVYLNGVSLEKFEVSNKDPRGGSSSLEAVGLDCDYLYQE